MYSFTSKFVNNVFGMSSISSDLAIYLKETAMKIANYSFRADARTTVAREGRTSHSYSCPSDSQRPLPIIVEGEPTGKGGGV